MQKKVSYTGSEKKITRLQRFVSLYVRRNKIFEKVEKEEILEEIEKVEKKRGRKPQNKMDKQHLINK